MFQRQGGKPGSAGAGRRGCHHDHRSRTRRHGQYLRGRLEVQWADDDRLGGPVRPRHLQRRQGGDQPTPRTGIDAGQPDPPAGLRALPLPGPHRPRGERPHGHVAKASPQAGARRQSAADRWQALGRVVQRVRAEFDPGNAGKFGGHPAAHGDHVGDHQIGPQIAQNGQVQHRHACGPVVQFGAGVGVVVGLVGV